VTLAGKKISLAIVPPTDSNSVARPGVKQSQKNVALPRAAAEAHEAMSLGTRLLASTGHEIMIVCGKAEVPWEGQGLADLGGASDGDDVHVGAAVVVAAADVAVAIK
jgi:hypothetical protein